MGIKYILAVVLVFMMGYIWGIYWHIKTAHKIINEALEKM